jgi:hypothetical protein
MRFGETTFFLTEETLFHGTATGDMSFPRLTRLVGENPGGVAVEIDGLVRHPYGRRGSVYSKGIYLEIQPDGAILLTELQTEHPGARPAGFGITPACILRRTRLACGHASTIPSNATAARSCTTRITSPSLSISNMHWARLVSGRCATRSSLRVV